MQSIDNNTSDTSKALNFSLPEKAYVGQKLVNMCGIICYPMLICHL